MRDILNGKFCSLHNRKLRENIPSTGYKYCIFLDRACVLLTFNTLILNEMHVVLILRVYMAIESHPLSHSMHIMQGIHKQFPLLCDFSHIEQYICQYSRYKTISTLT